MIAKQIIAYSGATSTRESAWVGWVPLIVLPAIALSYGFRMANWVFMWTLSFALYFGCKWLTWWQNKSVATTPIRHLGYLFLWPGMDAKTFLNPAKNVEKPRLTAWLGPMLNIGLGAGILWGVLRHAVISEPLLRGWIGLCAVALMLHFGAFHLLALAWRTFGVDAVPLMRAPIRATSLAEFWGIRWNSAFNRLVFEQVFRRLYRSIGAVAATLMVFLVSGLVHDLVISVPARGGYGLPTVYFLTQGAGMLFERTQLARKIGLRRGVRGWLFTVIVTAGPAFWLFHPAFITRVILPFLHALNTT